MVTEKTREKILNVAEALFADLGFDRASVRTITQTAGVDLGSVRYHFGSKKGLFDAVIERRLVPLNNLRMQRLQELVGASGDAAPTVEALLRAFSLPAFELMLDPHIGHHWVKLIARLRVDGDRFLSPTLPKLNQVIRKYLAVLKKTLPHLSEDELTYRWFFFFGAEVLTLQDRQTLVAINKNTHLEANPDQVLEELIRFAAAGLRAPSNDVGR